MNRSQDPERRDDTWVRKDDLTRDRQYRGVDPSGYEEPPRTIERRTFDWEEEAPGNWGETGGRWHDHEMPYDRGRELVGLGEGAERSVTRGQPRGGAAPRARELWPNPGAPGGGYGHGGREGPPQGAQAEGKPPRSYVPSDERLLDDVCRALADDPHVDAREVEVRVEAGEVILEGTIDSREAKRRAENLAASVHGVRDVVNRLRIETIGGP